ncbi:MULTISPECIES: hypothetical protein [unclassified Tatumella]|uniref:hypothetical protein n=1 Tax=unclassified Tatumella TaxID=2649542 RepID=UPI001BAF8DBC|nr:MULTISPECIES: hypothetical protein [unclassified Tatumella]MBS0878720.1 hypothetical protein [Tatumella sp. JGM82]MBS0891136.1 hypothetical protein [Tatumella sp. JGM94]MBS0903172.1 hypothetical protein [Tatumella sp. JGM100]
MCWERKKSQVTAMPEEPFLLIWLIGGLAALIAGGLIFVLHANQLLGAGQNYNIWVVSGSPPVIWIFCICLRAWLYKNGVDKHEFELKEADYSQQQWTEWAGHYLAVMSSEVILPQSLTVPMFIPESKGLEEYNGLITRLDISPVKAASLIQLEGVKDALMRFPTDIALKVFLLTDSPEEDAELRTVFYDCWRKLVPAERPVPALSVQRSLSFDFVEQRIKTPDISVELIMVQQLCGRDRYSDALATLLLTTDDVATKYELDHDVRLLRPMSLEGDDLLSELDLYFSTQTQSINTQNIIGDHVRWGQSFSLMLKASELYQGHWETEQLHWLETYAGRCGPFSPWIMTAIVSDAVQLLKTDCLMLSEGEGQKFINTVTTGNKNENS